MTSINDSRIIIEFIQVGAYVKVTAVDPVSLVEVSIVGDPSASRDTLEQTAIKKLRFVLSKRQK
ncbi:MAG: hypothetical protein CMM43_04495 [Rhodospirillaceae bacterium]|nr:hypothetical protein [Rhodospirillaceae bacterium]|tara:strand:- start:3584 stop:3775 length:192 start_codon:yes stop_codon:yes gene_type:complete